MKSIKVKAHTTKSGKKVKAHTRNVSGGVYSTPKKPASGGVYSTLHNKINTRGQYEQEKGHLFSGLYPDKAKAVTRSTKGYQKQFENKLKRRAK